MDVQHKSTLCRICELGLPSGYGAASRPGAARGGRVPRYGPEAVLLHTGMRLPARRRTADARFDELAKTPTTTPASLRVVHCSLTLTTTSDTRCGPCSAAKFWRPRQLQSAPAPRRSLPPVEGVAPEDPSKVQSVTARHANLVLILGIAMDTGRSLRGACRLGVGEVRGAEHGDENLRLADLSRRRIGDPDPLARIVDERLLPATWCWRITGVSRRSKPRRRSQKRL
jgi:hypothetical protein